MFYKDNIDKGPGKLFCSLIFSTFFLLYSAALGEMLSVKGDGVNLRTGPGKQYEVKCAYGSGFPVEILGRNGEWLKVKDFEDDTGWLHKSVLTASRQVIVKANRNKDEKINVRQGPGPATEIVGKAYYGVVFKIAGRQSEWIKVEHESGLTGWIYANLLWGL